MADRQTDMQSVFFAQAQSPWTTGQTRSPSELPGWSKVTTTYFLFVDQFVLSKRSDVAYIGLWPRAIYLLDRQTDRQTNR